MAGNNVSDSTNRDAVADYLAAVTARLTGPPAARVAVQARRVALGLLVTGPR